MFRGVSFIMLLALTLTGCAGQLETIDTPADHPGSVSAEVAPLHISTSTLAVIEPVTAGPLPAPHADHAHGHAEPTSDSAKPGTDSMSHEDAHGIDQRHEAAPHEGQQEMPSPEAPTYACPMHAEVRSKDPTVRCPKCGMKLTVEDVEEAAK